MDTKQLAVNKAMALLNAIGAQFHIMTADGTEYGAAPKKARTRVINPSLPKNRDYIVKHIGDMAIGDCRKFPPQEGDTLTRLQSSATSWAASNWGAGSYISSQVDGQLEILRVS